MAASTPSRNGPSGCICRTRDSSGSVCTRGSGLRWSVRSSGRMCSSLAGSAARAWVVAGLVSGVHHPRWSGHPNRLGTVGMYRTVVGRLCVGWFCLFEPLLVAVLVVGPSAGFVVAPSCPGCPTPVWAACPVVCFAVCPVACPSCCFLLLCLLLCPLAFLVFLVFLVCFLVC